MSGKNIPGHQCLVDHHRRPPVAEQPVEIFTMTVLPASPDSVARLLKSIYRQYGEILDEPALLC